jgi:internalin A
LLDYLNASGIILYREGLFDNAIVLDQTWALDAVYAVFHREKCYEQLRYLRGRFNRKLLEALVWSDYDPAEQELFLSLMTSCGICFVHRLGDARAKFETEYIAPDLLPSRDEVEGEIDALWEGHGPSVEVVVRLAFLHPGVARGIISRIGNAGGLNAVYWKYGACFYERTTGSHALIEQRPDNDETLWSGRIVVSTRGGQAAELLNRLRKWIVEEVQRSGCRDWTIEGGSDASRGSDRLKSITRSESHRVPASDIIESASETDGTSAEDSPRPMPLAIGPPARVGISYCVSYAWNDASTAAVDQLCSRASEKGISILRDKTGLGLGESLEKFMRQIGAGDRVFVILSEKYLQSANCMYELWEVWRNSKMDREAFRERIRVYKLPDTKIFTPLDRVRCAKFWREQFRELDAIVSGGDADLLGEADFRRYKQMSDFASHIGDMLALIADTLLPKDLAELENWGFDEGASGS